MKIRAVLLAATLVLAPGMLLAPRAAVAAEKVRFVQATTGLLYVVPMVAKELGFFAAEGVDTEIMTGLGGAEAMAAVIGNNADIYSGPPSTALRAREKGADPMIFAAGMTQYGSNVVVAKDWAAARGITADSPYEKKLQALKGARMAVLGIGSGTHQLVQFLAKQAGIDPARDVIVTNITKTSAILAAFEQGRIDGFAASSPTSDEAVRQGRGIMLFHTSKGEVKALDGFLYIGFIARESWLKANPALVKHTLAAMQKALDTIHSPTEGNKARDVIWQKYHAKTDKAFFDGIWADTLAAWPKTLELTPDMAKRAVSFLNEFSSPGYDVEAASQAFDFTVAKGAGK